MFEQSRGGNSPEFPDGSVFRKSRITAEKGRATVKDYLTVQNGGGMARVVKENLTTDREDMKALEEMEKAIEKRGKKKLGDKK